jgi:uncharacterized membrane protein YphA (DoxX/SURF4 family)
MSLSTEPERNGDFLLTLKRVARFCLGFIWIYLGLVPKLLFQVPMEREIVRRIGLYLFSPAATIRVLGVLEIGLGIWLLTGFRERLACVVTSAFLITMVMLVVFEEPMLLAGPFGGIAKNAGLLVLAWMVWRIASLNNES